MTMVTSFSGSAIVSYAIWPKSAIWIASLVLCCSFLATPTLAAQNYQFVSLRANFDIKISDTPYIFWSCFDKNTYQPEFNIAHFVGDKYTENTIAKGVLSTLSGCLPTEYRYDFNSLFDSVNMNSFFDMGYRTDVIVYKVYKSPNQIGQFAAGTLWLEYTYEELHPLDTNFQFGVSNKSSNFATGAVSKIAVSHNLDTGKARFTIDFRSVPRKNTKISFVASANNYSSSSDTSMACTDTEGWVFPKWPEKKITNEYDDGKAVPNDENISTEWKPSGISFSGKKLQITWAGDYFKARTTRETRYSGLPRCFALSIWKTTSSYSKGNSCSGVISGIFVDLQCAPYEGWSDSSTISKTYKISLPVPTTT